MTRNTGQFPFHSPVNSELYFLDGKWQLFNSLGPSEEWQKGFPNSRVLLFTAPSAAYGIH